MKRTFLMIIAAVALLFVAAACNKAGSSTFTRPDKADDKEETDQSVVGKPLAQWEEGELDIHAISTGRGECTYFILPDGTTIVCDAGDLYGYKSSSYDNVPTRPTSTSIPYQTQANYIKHFMPSGRSAIDYFVLTHFHIDHMGNSATGSRKQHPQGGYALCGVSGLYDEIKISKIIDRIYPAYSSVTTSDNMDFYVKFVEYNVKNSGLAAEKFEVGSSSQITEKRHNSKYPETKIFNWAANGIYWDGTKQVGTSMTAENALSCAFLLSYGKFDYWTSGDLNNNAVCEPVAKAIGHSVEAMKAMHHMSNPDPYAKEVKVYNPQVVVTQSFYVRAEQPQQSVIKSYAKTQDMFFTNIDESLLKASPDIYEPCKGINGHIVIRVAVGGESFMVYHLDDTDSAYKVKAVFGPYKCK